MNESKKAIAQSYTKWLKEPRRHLETKNRFVLLCVFFVELCDTVSAERSTTAHVCDATTVATGTAAGNQNITHSCINRALFMGGSLYICAFK
jgi:hypothetical protein